MINIISKSLAAKVLLALMLVILVMGISFVVMNKRLKTIEVSFNDISRISNYAVSILSINKDIVEMQRDISVYGSSGSEAVFSKIIENFDSVKSRLNEVNLKSDESDSQVYLDSMSELIDRYSDNLAVLTKRYEIRSELIEVELPSIYFEAVTHLENLKKLAVSNEQMLIIAESLNMWHVLHRDAYQFLTKKDYTKRTAVNNALQVLSGLNNDLAMTQQDDVQSEILRTATLASTYQNAFSKAIQANRNYFSLVNVVMAGDAIEFSTLANKLRENSLAHLNQIKKDAEITVSKTEKILKALAAVVFIYVLALAAFFHLQISQAIKRLTVSFQRFLEGDLSAPIHDLNRKDEIGVLASAADSFRILSRDLSEAKKVAEHTTKVKSEFLANMSHEIRTPMNGILGMARQLSRTTLTTEQAKMLAIIQSSGSSLLVIINDILDLSKIEASKIELESQPIKLSSILDELQHLFLEQAHSKNIQFNIETSPDGKEAIFLGDETRLKQVLINLLGNAIKFTERGNVTLSVEIAQRNDEFSLTFNVIDTGIGIVKEHMSNLFEAFSQADASITRRFGGTGLGLAISSKLLNLMGTTLHVESEAGVGSRFYFQMVAKQSFKHADIKEVTLMKFPDESFDFSRLNVLIVEDNEINQVVIEAMLNEFNISSIKIANDGEQAILQCEKQLFDIIFMDMQMPVLDGPQATIKIREKEAFKSTPIIALTANVLSADKQRCFDAGMNDFIAKPIKYESLKEVLLKWCTPADDSQEEHYTCSK
ncbi:response regulator [Pseudoalteromonas sp. MEBiC 03607]|uniref:hybrid sensor histidine kinase/response regulator n=1 Tax=Pseudoalteromonas sp. MEBiC 03607 TaxID=2563601 RepID=UPI0010938D6C|nr:ATP-binding protein [Pseudoalteromonas sp. MEBiC 03607]TGV20357.1 response regulator [Pseudoalteromonas sp. MEBiC 03607]